MVRQGLQARQLADSIGHVAIETQIGGLKTIKLLNCKSPKTHGKAAGCLCAYGVIWWFETTCDSGHVVHSTNNQVSSAERRRNCAASCPKPRQRQQREQGSIQGMRNLLRARLLPEERNGRSFWTAMQGGVKNEQNETKLDRKATA